MRVLASVMEFVGRESSLGRKCQLCCCRKFDMDILVNHKLGFVLLNV